MTDRSDHFSFLIHITYEAHYCRVAPQKIRLPAARNDHCIKITRFYVRNRSIDFDRVTILSFIYIARSRSDCDDFRPRFAQSQKRIPHFQILIVLLHKNGDSLSTQTHSFASFLILSRVISAYPRLTCFLVKSSPGPFASMILYFFPGSRTVSNGSPEWSGIVNAILVIFCFSDSTPLAWVMLFTPETNLS